MVVRRLTLIPDCDIPLDIVILGIIFNFRFFLVMILFLVYFIFDG